MTDAQLIRMAEEAGFAGAAIVPTADIVFDPAFRPYCEENLCGKYGVNYSCPPACGTPEEMKQRILAHSKALVLMTMWEVKDYADTPALSKGKNSHNSASVALARKLRKEGCPGLLVGSGGCGLCKPCALEAGKPCNFPEDAFSCMSAYCIFVKKLADSCGLEYDPGEGLVTFFGMYAFD